MSEFIVDKSTNTVRSVHEFPVIFSISGKYVINVESSLRVFPDNDSVNDLIGQKVDAYKALQTNPPLPNHYNDELITSPNIDTSNSSKYILGPQKRTALLPGGTIITNPFTFGTVVNNIFTHWHGFELFNKPNTDTPTGPSQVLYGFSESQAAFSPFVPSVLVVHLVDAPLALTTEVPLVSDTKQTPSLVAGDYRLRFVNPSSTITYFLSDWLILYDTN